MNLPATLRESFVVDTAFGGVDCESVSVSAVQLMGSWGIV